MVCKTIIDGVDVGNMPSKYKKLVIDPKIGVGPIHFSMHQKKVEKILKTINHADQIEIKYNDEHRCNGLIFSSNSLLYLNVQLTPEQRREFWRRGIPFLNAIAENIRYYGK